MPPPPPKNIWLVAARAAWLVMIALTVIILIAAIPPGYQSTLALAEELNRGPLPLPAGPVAVYLVAVQLIFAAGCILPAALLFRQRSANAVALLVSLVGGVFAVNIPIVFALFQAQPAWQRYFLALIFFSQVAGLAANFVFPDGRFVPRWTRWLAALLGAWYLLAVIFPAAPFSPEELPLPVTFSLLLVLGGTAIGAQIYRYRRVSTPAQRQQTKWILFGVVIAVLGFAGAEMIVFIPALSRPGWLHLVYELLLRPLSRLAVLVAPLSILISILRYRLWEIDFVINRSLVYGALTGFLALLLAFSLYIVSLLFQNASGGPLIALALSSAAFGALFQPARRAVQRFVDRRFYHIGVDYQPARRPAGLPPDAAAVLKNTRFSEYREMQMIGSGGMAEVYKAAHPTLGVPVAIKLLPARRAADPQFRIRFQREAQAVAQLEHPNIIRLFDFGVEAGVYYIVMEYLAGPPLDRWLNEQGRLPLDRALPLLRQIAGALDYAHQKGLVHRDVKPSNIMFASPMQPDAAPRVVLMDFGIAKLPGEHTALTRTGTLGTFDYIAPEQIQASAEVDHRADIYAFGVLAYQMLTGELPFISSNPGALLIAHLTQPPPNPRLPAPDLPEAAAQALLRALAKQPAGRFASAGEFVGAMGMSGEPDTIKQSGL